MTRTCRTCGAAVRGVNCQRCHPGDRLFITNEERRSGGWSDPGYLKVRHWVNVIMVGAMLAAVLAIAVRFIAG